MTFIPANLDDTIEQKPVPKGKYDLMITNATVTTTGENSKHPGAPMIKAVLGFADTSIMAPVITHFITFPFEGDENANFKLLMLKRLLVAFGIPYSNEGIDIEALAMEMVGHTATLDVGLSSPNDNGDIYNNVQIPRIRDEAAVGGVGKKRTR